jgi:hypothetical protein
VRLDTHCEIAPFGLKICSRHSYRCIVSFFPILGLPRIAVVASFRFLQDWYLDCSLQPCLWSRPLPVTRHYDIIKNTLL